MWTSYSLDLFKTFFLHKVKITKHYDVFMILGYSIFLENNRDNTLLFSSFIINPSDKNYVFVSPAKHSGI